MSDAKVRLESSPFYDRIKEKIRALRLLVKELYRDGKISRRDVLVLVRRVIREANTIIKDIDGIDDSARKQLFVDICVAAWEDLGRPAKIIPDIALIPDWMEEKLEEKVVDPMLGSLIEVGAEIAYTLMWGE